MNEIALLGMSLQMIGHPKGRLLLVKLMFSRIAQNNRPARLNTDPCHGPHRELFYFETNTFMPVI